MTARAILALLVLWLMPAIAKCQETPPDVFEGSIFVASPHPALFEELKIDAYERLEGSIVVEDKAASVTYAPFLFTGEYSWLSETRVKVGQKDTLTSVGLQLLYNPLSPRTDKNLALWGTALEGLGVLQEEAYVAIDTELKAFSKAQDDADISVRPRIKVLRDEIALLQQELDIVEPPLKPERRAFLEKEVESKKKELEPLPKEAQAERRRVLLEEIEALEERINILKERLAIATPSEKPAILEELERELKSLEMRRNQLAFNRPEAEPFEAQLRITALKARQAELVADFEKRAAGKLLAYYKAILDTKLPIVGLSYGATFFPVLDQSGFTDADNDQLDDNEHRLNSRSLALTADLRLSERLQLSGLAGYTWKRPSAEAGSVLGEARNFGLTIGWVASILDKDFAASDEYKESFFIPSVVLGLALEQARCASSSATCVDAIEQQTVATPFIDLKLKKASQFRIGIPWKRTEKVDASTDDSFELVTAIAFQLGQPK